MGLRVDMLLTQRELERLRVARERMERARASAILAREQMQMPLPASAPNDLHRILAGSRQQIVAMQEKAARIRRRAEEAQAWAQGVERRLASGVRPGHEPSASSA
jgi:hypothetical protein